MGRGAAPPHRLAARTPSALYARARQARNSSRAGTARRGTPDAMARRTAAPCGPDPARAARPANHPRAVSGAAAAARSASNTTVAAVAAVAEEVVV